MVSDRGPWTDGLTLLVPLAVAPSRATFPPPAPLHDNLPSRSWDRFRRLLPLLLPSAWVLEPGGYTAFGAIIILNSNMLIHFCQVQPPHVPTPAPRGPLPRLHSCMCMQSACRAYRHTASTGCNTHSPEGRSALFVSPGLYPTGGGLFLRCAGRLRHRDSDRAAGDLPLRTQSRLQHSRCVAP